MTYNKDVSFMYKHESLVLHPRYQAYHVSDATTDVFFSINSKELLYTKQSGETDYTSRVVISYILTLTYESKQVIDSGLIRLSDVVNDNNNKFINGKFTIRAASGNDYLLKLTMLDLNRNQQAESFIELHKINSTSYQNFLVTSEKTDDLLFRNYILPKENVKIIFRRTPQNKLYVKYFNRDFPIASAPFSIIDVRPFSYTADSNFVVALSDSGTATIHLEKPGIYSFVTDTNQREGLTLYRFYDGFPDVIKAEHMVPPIRFITSKEEFDNISSSKTKKGAVEGFWLNCAGSQDRAREVIRKYYNRVSDANIYFSSYLEGWKTDRGMIYLIFGPPNLVYKSNDSETWVYGEDNNLNSLNFNFNKVSNPIAENDFILQRSTIYKSNWYLSVDIWRQGRIYLQN